MIGADQDASTITIAEITAKPNIATANATMIVRDGCGPSVPCSDASQRSHSGAD